MKVRITGQPAGNNKGQAWEVGSTVDVPDDKAQELIGARQAVAVDWDAVVEKPSALVSEAEARQAYAETVYATPQEKKQAAVERQDLQRGTHARLHQTDLPTLAVADEQHAESIALDGDELFANKGPVEARPDSAGVEGVPNNQLAEPVSASSGPAKDVDVNVPDVASGRKAQTSTPPGKATAGDSKADK